jgi:hypothetical protein
LSISNLKKIVEIQDGVNTKKKEEKDLEKDKEKNCPNDKILNPKLIMRFDCHKINDIQCVKLYENSKKQQESDVTSILYLIAACNDNYVRFFNL